MNTRIQNILFHRRWWLLRHFLFWIFIYLDEFLSFIGITHPYEEYFSIFISLTLDIIIVYFNIYILIPRFLRQNRFVEYAGFTILSVVLLFGGEYLMERFYWQEGEMTFEYFIHIFVQTTVTLAAAVAVKVLKEAISENRRRKEIEKEKLAFELQHLKKQVNPHFLFNVLNGIYIQSQTDHNAVPDTIMQLSDLLRYQIYDAENNSKVLMTKEVEFIKNYVALEQMRRENTEVTANFDIENSSSTIEPLLFISLIENAFKYSIPKKNEKSRIEITLFEKQNTIELSISNTIGLNPSEDNSNGGFGLQNLKKRLELLYPNTHSLTVDVTKDGIFRVDLEISCDEMPYN